MFKNNNKDFYNNGLIRCSFNLKIKVNNSKDALELLASSELKSRNIDYMDNSSQIDKDDYMIDPIYFYRLIIKKVDFVNTYIFNITHKDKFLTRDNILLGSVLYTLPKISYKNVKLIYGNQLVKLKLTDINQDSIFKLPMQYKNIDINIQDIESFISYKMFLRYEILKLQWELTSVIKNSDIAKKAKNIAHENDDDDDSSKDYLTLKLEFFQVVK